MSPGAATRGAVAQWCAATERYPFQKIIRNAAASLADPDPIAPFAPLFADPLAVLRQVLERAEARLREVYTRPLVAAVNQARQRGRLVGTNPAVRYEYFVDQSIRGSFEELSGLSFPVLRNVTRVVLAYEVHNFLELCLRLIADRDAIADTFGIDAADQIVSCGFADGDAHHHGRSVSVLEFRSGRKLAYKPRDVSCEAAYAVIAREANEWLGTSLVAPEVLERAGYGYVEYVAAADVADMSARFMEASGELAAVMYLLNAQDMHVENVVATRRGPVPIDLETILQPVRIHLGPPEETPGNAHHRIAQSVYGIGILPLLMAGRDEDSGYVDLGFLGEQGGGESPFKSLRFDAPFTDEVRLTLRKQAAEKRRTVVGTLSQDEVHALGERMAAGFTRVCRAVMSDKGRWTALVREAAAGVRVRYLHHPTMVYAQTLRTASSARAMSDPASYLAVLKRVAIPGGSATRAIVRSELRQLAGRDVPYFTVGAADVALTDGEETEVGALLAGSPLDVATAKVAALTEFEVGEQLRLIHSAFSCRFPDDHLTSADSFGPGLPRNTARGRPTGRPGDTLAGVVTRLCDTMVASALPDRYARLPHTWIGPLASAQANRPWPPAVLGYDLYTGRVGPALALAAAGRVLDRSAYRDLATQIFSATAEGLSDPPSGTSDTRRAAPFSAYAGSAGTLLTLALAGRLLGAPGWVRVAQQAVPTVLDLVDDQPTADLPLDVISGLAGVLSCVTAIGGPHSDASAAALTAMLTDALRQDAHHPVLDQSGFGHGVSGVIHALSRAYPGLPEGRRAAVEATLSRLIGRLRDFYDPAEGDWYSNVATPWSFATGWCHGSAGIALALTAYGAVSEDASVERMRKVAVGNMLRRGFGRNLTWCHGDLGNHDILSAVASTEESLRAAVEEVERTWLRPEVFARKAGDTRSRYAHTNSLLVGTAGMVIHLVNRLDPSVRLSPVDLTAEGR
ncbi:type 2 lanthipeptide synthetase LanM family protein [Streptomyces sp. ME19-01-6]|uniref:type 2 lanthipeptide synthetase LanM family protein n=1 Tax=Streptomyces sp. ME19-01-6 TaxID=3028686 RepID=UPI0029B53C67|nr:type 2 lanthipeptide synthetase LanM family protein [Streptomyces sp. ME19-01-6]MDX3229891.1 type 2 lanthipeptide synthetase LanM family protein [Streptomyces sp. ME19-01-6]